MKFSSSKKAKLDKRDRSNEREILKNREISLSTFTGNIKTKKKAAKNRNRIAGQSSGHPVQTNHSPHLIYIAAK